MTRIDVENLETLFFPSLETLFLSNFLRYARNGRSHWRQEFIQTENKGAHSSERLKIERREILLNIQIYEIQPTRLDEYLREFDFE